MAQMPHRAGPGAPPLPEAATVGVLAVQGLLCLDNGHGRLDGTIDNAPAQVRLGGENLQEDRFWWAAVRLHHHLCVSIHLDRPGGTPDQGDACAARDDVVAPERRSVHTRIQTRGTLTVVLGAY